MDATDLNCPACRAVRPIRFEPLLAGEPALGTCICCAHCRRHAFTLLKPARFYCEICDEIQPGMLERIELASVDKIGVLLVCAGCFDAKAMLYASARTNRYAGAEASDPPPPGLPADRARRG